MEGSNTFAQRLSARVRETGETRFAVDIWVGGHLLKGDLPAPDSAKGIGPAPHEMLLASLGECTAMTVRWYAQRHFYPLEAVNVDLTYRKGSLEGREGTIDVFTKAVQLTGPALTQEQRARLIDVAAKCPIQRLLEGVPVITTAEDR